MNVDNLNKALGTDLQSDNDGGIYLNKEQAEALETHLGTMGTAPEPKREPVPEPAKAPQAKQEPDTDPNAEALQNALAEIENLKNTVQQLQDQPGATTAKAAPNNDPGKTDGVQLASKEGADFWENVQKVKEAYIG